MVTIELDPSREQRLQELARSHGKDTAAFARNVLEEYLDLEALPADSEEDWAEASVALTTEVLEAESWDEGPIDGPR